MAFQKNDNDDTGHWNANEGIINEIVNIKLAITYFKSISRFGAIDIVEARSMPEEMKGTMRFDGIVRYHYFLKEIYIKCLAFIRGGDNITNFKSLRDDLNVIEGALSSCQELRTIKNKKFMAINEVNFTKIFKKLDFIEGEINYPLNKSGIFMGNKEPWDAKKFKADSLKIMSGEDI